MMLRHRQRTLFRLPSTSNIDTTPSRYISSPGGCLTRHFVWCLIALYRLFMYLRQNSQIHSRPSGMLAYSSGNGASYHVRMSYGPKRIVRMRSTPASNLGSVGGPGVEGAGEARREGRGVEEAVSWAIAAERRGRPTGTGVDTSRFAVPRAEGTGAGGGGGTSLACSTL